MSRYAGLPGAPPGGMPPLHHFAAMYGGPAASQLERERLERLGIPAPPPPNQQGPPGSQQQANPHHPSAAHAAHAAHAAQLEAAERLALATDPMVSHRNYLAKC